MTFTAEIPYGFIAMAQFIASFFGARMICSQVTGNFFSFGPFFIIRTVSSWKFLFKCFSLLNKI